VQAAEGPIQVIDMAAIDVNLSGLEVLLDALLGQTCSRQAVGDARNRQPCIH
jgi:hypothetical protein